MARRVSVAVTMAVVSLVCMLFVGVAAAHAHISTGGGGWVWQNPLPQGNDLGGVDFADADHGWVVGSDGVILATTDAGASWYPQSHGTARYLADVAFPTLGSGWAVGADGTIVATADGGAHWAKQSSGTVADLDAVDFVDAQVGWAVGSGGTILATVDGGATWMKQKSGTDQPLMSVDFIDSMHGWAGSYDFMLRTTDGGVTWKTLPAVLGFDSDLGWGVTGISFLDADHGWASESSGDILKTIDGGLNWTVQRPSDGTDLYDIVFTDASHGYAVGTSKILWTTDGGLDWQSHDAGTGDFLYAVAALNDGHAWAVGPSGSMVRGAGFGATWTAQSVGAGSDWFTDVDFIDSSHGWAVGMRGIAKSTADGGTTWITHDLGLTGEISDIDFADLHNGWLTGEDGVYRTTNGGVDWQRLASAPASSKLDFLDSSHGWAVGDWGKIWSTSDGGTTWGVYDTGIVPNDHGVGGFLADVCFVDAQHGWATGSGYIFATTDGGLSWHVQHREDYGWTDAICFVDDDHGWAVGEIGQILATVNGGQTWQTQHMTTPEDLFYDVCFVDQSRGWVVGDMGLLLATADGGTTWRAQDAGHNLDMYSLDFVDQRHGWIAGNDMMILATSTGGFAPGADTTAPLTTISGAEKLWHRGPVLLTLTAADEPGGSGVSGGAAKTEYRLDGGVWTTGTSLTVSGERVHTVDYRSTDAAGNREPAKSATVGIDGTPPVSTLTGADGAWHNGPVTLQLAAGDALSGLAAMSYCLDGGSAQPCAGPLLISVPGDHSLAYFSTDLAGNAEAARSVAVRIDTGKPSSMAAGNVTAKKGKKASLSFKVTDPSPSCGSATVVITIKRKNTTVKTITIRNATTSKAARCSFKVTLRRGSYTWTVKATDIAGNAGRASAAKKLIVT